MSLLPDRIDLPFSWQNHRVDDPSPREWYFADICMSPVVFFMRRGQIFCSVCGTGRAYKIEELSPEHENLIQRVREFYAQLEKKNSISTVLS